MSEPKIHISRAIWDEDTHEVAYIVDGLMFAEVATQRKLNAVDDMYEALEAYEKAEADIILNANWYTESGVPQITQEQFDMLIDCQTIRDKALRKARGEEE